MERLTDKNFRIGFDDSDKLPSYVSIYERLREYEDLEEQGELLKPPCKTEAEQALAEMEGKK